MWHFYEHRKSSCHRLLEVYIDMVWFSVGSNLILNRKMSGKPGWPTLYQDLTAVIVPYMMNYKCTKNSVVLVLGHYLTT